MEFYQEKSIYKALNNVVSSIVINIFFIITKELWNINVFFVVVLFFI